MIPDGMSRVDVEIIESFARNGMKIQRVADDVKYDPRVVRYHLEKVHRLTGLNPRDFYDLYELIQILKGDANAQRNNVRKTPECHRRTGEN